MLNQSQDQKQFLPFSNQIQKVQIYLTYQQNMLRFSSQICSSNMVSSQSIFYNESLLPSLNQSCRLHFQELATQPAAAASITSTRKLTIKHNSWQNQNQKQTRIITQMQTKCYQSSLIYLENQIQYANVSQCLKRFYCHQQLHAKILMLGEYYKYHQDQPRIFLSDLESIVSTYQEEKRQLQYRKVRQKIQEQNQVDLEQYCKRKPALVQSNCSKKKIIPEEKLKIKKPEKMLKNIHLSYANFENKPVQKESLEVKAKQIRRKNSEISTKQNIISKCNSLNCKQTFSRNFEHPKLKEQPGSRRIFSYKNAESRELKQLESKYCQRICQLHKKQRSSSTNIKINPKVQKKQFPELETGQTPAIIIESSEFENIGVLKIQSPPHKKLQQKKILRSKSQTAINLCKSHQLLKSFKNKIHDKIISINSKYNHHFISKQNSKKKHDYQDRLHNEQTLKKQKFSSTKSLKEYPSNLINQQAKTVKIFQITRKDLTIDPISKNVNIKKEQTINKRKLKEGPKNILCEKKQAKQNRNNQTNKQNDIKNIKGFISKPSMHKNNIGRNFQSKIQQKVPAIFNRVIKNKIRG